MWPETSPPRIAPSFATFCSMKLCPTLHMIGSVPILASWLRIAWENFMSVMILGRAGLGFCSVRRLTKSCARNRRK